MPSRKKVVIKISGLQPLKNKVISWLHSISILGKFFLEKKKKKMEKIFQKDDIKRTSQCSTANVAGGSRRSCRINTIYATVVAYKGTYNKC